jgi:hypothetical protein
MLTFSPAATTPAVANVKGGGPLLHNLTIVRIAAVHGPSPVLATRGGLAAG